MEFLDYLKENNIDYKEEDGKIVVSGGLVLCLTDVTRLPDDLSVGGDLVLCYSQITKLPDNLSVSGYLNLWGTKITELPEGLSVGGDLDLYDTQITKLPEDLSVKGGLDLDTEKITNIACRENCGEQHRTIFSAYVNEEIQISAGCFLGILKKFESAVDDKYSGTKAEKYKQAARECVKELEEMRKDKTKLKKIHELKISSQHFKDVVSGAKTAEIRYRDRDY